MAQKNNSPIVSLRVSKVWKDNPGDAHYQITIEDNGITVSLPAKFTCVLPGRVVIPTRLAIAKGIPV